MYHLLVVDDDEYCQDVLSDTLDNSEYRITLAGNGKEAITAVNQDDVPDLVLMDIDMPEMDGVSALKEMKRNPDTQGIPVIMVTAVNADAQIAACLDIGAVDHIVKPYSNAVVRARVRSALRMVDRLRESALEAGTVGRTVAFIGGKGGVGTTTVAVNTAASLASMHRSAILCDMAAEESTLATQLGIDPRTTQCLESVCHSGQAHIGSRELADCIVPHQSGFNIVLGGQTPVHAQPFTAEQIESAFWSLSRSAEFVLFDLPRFMTVSVDVVLNLVDRIVLVSEIEPSAVAATRSLYQRLCESGCASSKFGLLLVYRVAYSCPMKPAEIQSMFDCPILGIVPPSPDECVLAAKRHVPLVQSVQSCSAAGALRSFAMRVESGQFSTLTF